MTQIESLVLRIPGMDEAAGRQIGEDVARRVAEGLPEHGANRHIAELNLQVKLSPDIGRNQMAGIIAEQIIQQLKIATLT